MDLLTTIGGIVLVIVIGLLLFYFFYWKPKEDGEKHGIYSEVADYFAPYNELNIVDSPPLMDPSLTPVM
jgi:hypothetical protein